MDIKSLTSHPRFISASVWIARIVVGGCFIFSGFAKADDPWGTVFKIEQYLSAWSLSQPRSLVVAAAFSLAAVEFMLGIALLLGIYRRIAPKGVALMMLVFLPLTAYIALTSPVDDCGCFGDAWVLSNTATFLKNVLLAALTVPLLLWNRRIVSLFTPGLQWIVATFSVAYIFIIAMMGYHIQPLVDFRSFPVGTVLNDPDEDSSDPSVVFIYSKDGVQQEFDASNLPSKESGWEFVDRKEVSGKTSPFIIENEDGEDITEDLVGDHDTDWLLLVIPEPKRADLASTMQINQLWRMTTALDSVAMIALVGDSDSEDIARWQDLSMAEYPIYTTESTTLKDLARGNISAVYVRDGKVSAKISMAALSSSDISAIDNDTKNIEQALTFNGSGFLSWLTIMYAGVLLIVFIAALPRRIYLLRKLHKS
ncbi:MAG: DoxX family protein [Muribaculaceae bacterium]|nr:DoxX family protein [Muribaculaceae bacterium]